MTGPLTIELAEAAGRAAYRDGLDRAPALDARFMELAIASPVPTVELVKARLRGYDAEALSPEAEWEETFSLYSDLHKDRYGFRPRGEHLRELSIEGLRAAIDALPPYEEPELAEPEPESGEGWALIRG